MNSNRLIITAVVLLATALPTFAQPAPTSRPGAGPGAGGQPAGPGMIFLQRLGAAVQSLNLTDEQKPKVQAIFQKMRDDAQAMRQDLQNMSPQDRQQRVQELVRGAVEQITEVLTPEQREQFLKQVEQLRQNMRNGATSRATTGPAAGGPLVRYFASLAANLQKLDLSDEQKTQLKAMMDEVHQRGEEIRASAQSDPQGTREKGRALFQDISSKLQSILTPDQQNKLRNLMTAEGFGQNFTGVGPSNQGGQNRQPPPARQGAGNGQSRRFDRQNNALASAAVAPASQPSLAGPSPGDPAPSFSLKKLDGSLVQLSSLTGRVIVLEFGSYSSPTFRDHVAAMEKLRNDYGLRAQFFVVYQREAHAVGEWEVDRNKDAGISVEQPRTYEARRTLAQTAHDSLKIATPILLDTIGNDTAIAYGATENSAYVINRDGVVAARQQWFDPYGLHKAIDQATAAHPTTRAMD